MESVPKKNRKTLTDHLRAMQIGQQIIVRNRAYKATTVRNVLTRLKQEGLLYECTEKDCIDYVKVSRIK